MSWDFFTWLSIGVLVIGSVVVFVWFARDVRRMVWSRKPEAGSRKLRQDRSREEAEGSGR